MAGHGTGGARVWAPIGLAVLLTASAPGCVALAGATAEQSGTTPATAAACHAVAGVTPPASDQPTPAQEKSLAGCDAEALYYGMGRPADPVQARLCAFSQMKRSNAANADDADGNGAIGFSGEDLLLTIYANGVGAARNLPYATKLACDMWAAPAETDGRVANLVGKQQSHWTGTNFSWCDDVTSGYASGACSAHEQRIGDIATQAKLNAMAAHWTGAAASAFTQLRAAQAAWSKARGVDEVDLSGSARASFIVDEERLQDKDFLDMLERLQSSRPPHLDAANLRSSDARLNTLFNQIQALKNNTLQGGTVTKEQVRQVQRVWLHYRDAWGAFAAAAYPQWGADAAKAWVTMKRADMLASFLQP